MAYVYTDPTSIDYVLQRAHDELRRGESQHYRSTEAQYTHHVKELLGNLERYLETCGVRLPADVQEGAEMFAAASAANEQAAAVVAAAIAAANTPSPRAPPPLRSSRAGRSVSSGGVEEASSGSPSGSPDVSVRTGWGSVALGSRLVAAYAPTSPLGPAYHGHLPADNRSVRTTNSEYGTSTIHNSQQATRAHPACSSSSPSNAAEGNAESNITSLMFSGEADGGNAQSYSLDSGSAPIVPIVGSGGGGGSSAAAGRGREDAAGSRSSRALPNPSDTQAGARGASEADTNHSTSTHPTVSNALAAAGTPETGSLARPAGGGGAGHDHWGDFGTFVQSITDSRLNSNLASLQSAVAAAACPLPDGVSTSGALMTAIPAAMRDADPGGPTPAVPAGAKAPAVSVPAAAGAPGSAVVPRTGFQLPYVFSTDTSITTPSSPVLAVVPGRHAPSPLGGGGPASGCASDGPQSPPLPLPLQVAHGAGSSAVRVLVTAAGVSSGGAEAGGESLLPPSAAAPAALLPAALHEGEVRARVDRIPSPPQGANPHRQPAPPHSVVAVPVHRAASGPAVMGGGYGYDKEQLMRRLRQVLDRPASVGPPTDHSMAPSAAGAGGQTPLSDTDAWGARDREEASNAVVQVMLLPAPPLPSRAWLVGTNAPPSPPSHPQPPAHFLRPTATANRTRGKEAGDPPACAARAGSPTDPGAGDGAVRGFSQDELWSVLRLASEAASGRPYTVSSRDHSSGPPVSRTASHGTVQPRETGDEENSGSRRSRGQAQTVAGPRGTGSHETTSPAAASTVDSSAAPSASAVRGHRATPPSAVVTPWARPTRGSSSHQLPIAAAAPAVPSRGGYPPGPVTGDVGGGSRAGEETPVRQSASGDSGTPSAVKLDLMQRLRSVLSRPEST